MNCCDVTGCTEHALDKACTTKMVPGLSGTIVLSLYGTLGADAMASKACVESTMNPALPNDATALGGSAYACMLPALSCRMSKTMS